MIVIVSFSKFTSTDEFHKKKKLASQITRIQIDNSCETNP
jgi:hypothetical protein